MKRIQKYKRSLLVALVFLQYIQVGAQGVLEISNSLAEERSNEVFAVPWRSVQAVYPGINKDNFILYDPVKSKQVPFQLEYYGEESIKNLLLQVSIPAKGKIKLLLQKGIPEKFSEKTYCRYVPERKDDFAWENDKIAFRAYGKSLENTNENAYGFDVWVKRVSSPVINDRYKGNDYHVDHGDGLDYYQVGLTLGAGAIAPFMNDSIWYSANYHNWKVLDNGPLRSTFQLQYDQWPVASRKVKLTLVVSIDAGSQIHKVEAVYDYADKGILPVAVGIVQRGNQGAMMPDKRNGIAAYWEPTDPQNGTTGVGCIFPTPVDDMITAKGQLLTILHAYAGKPLTYYRGAAWDKAGEILSAAEWKKYLNTQLRRLKDPLQVKVSAKR